MNGRPNGHLACGIAAQEIGLLRMCSRILCLALLLGAAAQACATGLIERLLEFDLNDYAVGGASTVTESPYAGVKDSTVYYPIIIQPFPSAFGDEVVFTRDNGYGLRWLPGERWEIGALARFQPLGFVSGDSIELAGMPDRPWTLELGSTVGWRGPVHLDWTVYFDALRNQTGASHFVRLSVPRRGNRSYVIPEIGWRRYTAEFADYYFGVPESSATAARPAYTADTADGWSAAITWGTRIGAAWLLSGKIGVEQFGDSIKASPIVDDDRRGYVSLRIAYDRPMFAPLELGDEVEAAREQPPVELRIAGADVGTDVWFLDGDPESGERAGARDDDAAYLDLFGRFAPRHYLHAGAFDAVHNANPDSELPSFAQATFRQWYLGYSINVLDQPQKTLRVAVGINESRMTLEGTGSVLTDRHLRSKSPRPYLAAKADARFKRKLGVSAQVYWALNGYEGYSGARLLVAAAITHRTFRRAEFGLGYIFNRLSIEPKDSDTGRLDFDYDGPLLMLTGYL